MSWLYQPLLPASAEIESSSIPDTTPDQFTFTDQTNVAINTVITSNSFTVTGINNDTAISVTGGSYNINGGAYQTTPSTVAGGEIITVRHTSSSSYSTATNTTLTIGGVSDTFTSTTEIAPIVALSTAYWVGGSGTWSATNTANWASTSGGAGGAGYPDATSTVYFDSNSGTGTVTINGGVCNDFNISVGVSAITLAPTTSGLTIYGNATVSSTNATISGSAAITFAATTSKTITSGGETFDCPVTFNGVGGTWQLQDNLTVESTRTTTLTMGTLSLNNNTLSTGLFLSSNSNIRTIAFGTSGQITITGETTSTIWDTSTVSNLTITGTPLVVTTGSGATTKTINAGQPTNPISFIISNTQGTISFSSTSAFNNLTISNNSITINNSSINIRGDLTIAGTNPIFKAGIFPWTFYNSSTSTITTNGKILDFPLGFGTGLSQGIYVLGDNLTLGNTVSATLNIGTLNLNGKTLSVGESFIIDGSSPKNLTFNGGTLLCRGVSTTAFNNTAPANFTTTAGAGLGKISMSGATAKTFVGSGSIYNCTLENSGAGALTISGSNSFNDISNSVQPTTIRFSVGTTTTVNDFTVSGTAGNIVTISSTGGAFTLSKTSGTVNVNYCSISNSTATGGATWQAFTANGNTNGGGNTGWIFAGNTLSSGSILLIF